MLADPRLPADRPQPPPRRHRHAARPADELPRLHRPHPRRGRHARPDPAATRATRRSRSASGTSPRATERSPSGPFENWPLGQGLRALLRVPRRRHEPLGTGADPRQHLRRPAPHARRGLPPERGSRRRGDRPAARAAPQPARPTVPALARHWAQATRPTTWPPSGSNATRTLRRRLGRVAPGDAGPPGRRSASCRPAPSCPHPSEHVPDWDDLDADHRRCTRAHDGGVRRVPHPRRRADRPGARRARRARRAGRTPSWSSSRTTARRARPGRTARSSEFRFAQGRDEDLGLNLAHIDDLGGLRSYNHYPWGWAEAGNTPFRRFKRYTFEGGVRDPLIISWPAGLGAAGEIRHQYSHAVDVLPTLLDLLGIDAAGAAERGTSR